MEHKVVLIENKPESGFCSPLSSSLTMQAHNRDSICSKNKVPKPNGTICFPSPLSIVRRRSPAIIHNGILFEGFVFPYQRCFIVITMTLHGVVNLILISTHSLCLFFCPFRTRCVVPFSSSATRSPLSASLFLASSLCFVALCHLNRRNATTFPFLANVIVNFNTSNVCLYLR